MSLSRTRSAGSSHSFPFCNRLSAAYFAICLSALRAGRDARFDGMASSCEKHTGTVGRLLELTLRPLREGDEAELRRIHSTSEVARWWDLPEDGFPWSDEPDATRLTIE